MFAKQVLDLAPINNLPEDEEGWLELDVGEIDSLTMARDELEYQQLAKEEMRNMITWASVVVVSALVICLISAWLYRRFNRRY